MPALVMHDVVKLPTALLREAPWNANHVSKAKLAKIKSSLEQYGIVENSVVRPDWTIGCKTAEELSAKRAILMAAPVFFETLSGNHRLSLYRETGMAQVSAVIVEVTDAHAKVLAQVLNRGRGTDKPDKLKALLLAVLNPGEGFTPATAASLLPQSERDLLKLLKKEDDKDDNAPAASSGGHDSQLGTIYKLGPHRLLCGSSADPVAFAALRENAAIVLMATDPPYGVELDQGWRDNATMERIGGQAADDPIVGDAGFEWADALRLPGAPVAYVWHASVFASKVEGLLHAYGYKIRKQLIWNKSVHVLSRTPYHWQHEPCWYAVKAGVAEPWYGGANQTTVWNAASPKQIMGGTNPAQAGEEGKTSHPTQKPIVLFETPIVNHLRTGEVVYDPFGGSGSCLIAAAKSGRVCLTADLEPKWCDVIRKRWTKYAEDKGQDPGSGALA